MLVICPECKAKISEEADPCPKCGFPKAGHQSEEFIEKDSQKEAQRISLSRKRYIECINCNFSGEIMCKPVRVEIIKYHLGYRIEADFKCPECGGEKARKKIFQGTYYE